MKIALIGYGKMGKEIASIAQERGHEVALIIDMDNQHDLTKGNLQHVDVAIEFTSPATAVSNLMACFEAGVPVVCGTTGWLAQLEEVVGACNAWEAAFFYASNYSVGVNMFFKLSNYLAKMMETAGAYEVTMEEIHHTAKKDAPSGTAITLAEGIIKEIKSLSKWINDTGGQPGELPIVSKREDPAPGTHIVVYDSEVDTITIRHEAKSRKGFALGAVLAAEFLRGKQGCYTMDDLLKF